MNTIFPEVLLEVLLETIRQQKIIAVVVVDDAKSAVPLARALLDGGISVMEKTHPL